MISPVKSAFDHLPASISEASYTMGKSNRQTLFYVLLPAIRPAILTASVLTFAHTLGEFGVVLMIGGNIGKNKITPNEDAVSDYIKCFDRLFDVVDYFVVNVSSPNTPGLRELQEKEPLNERIFD